MRVLHSYSGNLYGGVETLLVTLARSRDHAGEMRHEFALCFEGRLSRELAGAGAAVHAIDAVRTRNPVSIWRARRRFAELLAARHFDVVICHMAWAQAIFGPVARAARTPLVFWMHLVTDGRHWLERWARRTRPQEVLAPSKFAANTASNVYPGLRAHTLYYPVAAPDDSLFDRNRVRNELTTPKSNVVIIQASRLEVWKGQRVMLEALGRLRQLTNWTCWIAGGIQRRADEYYLQELNSAARQMGIAGRVRFLGERCDVRRLLAAADIYCQPNTGTEGLPIVFTESLYAGLPVVSTTMGGFCEMIDDSCGVLVPPDDPGALASALGRIIQDDAERARLSAHARLRARELCDVDSQITRLGELLGRATRCRFE